MASIEPSEYLDDKQIFILENILEGLDDVFLANINEIKIKKSYFSNSMIIDCGAGNKHFTHTLPEEFESVFSKITNSLREDINYIVYTFNTYETDLFIITENIRICFDTDNIRLFNRNTGSIRYISLDTLKSTYGLILSIIEPLLKAINHAKLNEKENIYRNHIYKDYDRNPYSSSERLSVFNRESLEQYLRHDVQIL